MRFATAVLLAALQLTVLPFVHALAHNEYASVAAVAPAAGLDARSTVIYWRPPAMVSTAGTVSLAAAPTS